VRDRLDGNQTWDNYVAYSWQPGADDRLVVAVNASAVYSQCFVRLPFPELAGGQWRWKTCSVQPSTCVTAATCTPGLVPGRAAVEGAGVRPDEGVKGGAELSLRCRSFPERARLRCSRIPSVTQRVMFCRSILV